MKNKNKNMAPPQTPAASFLPFDPTAVMTYQSQLKELTDAEPWSPTNDVRKAEPWPRRTKEWWDPRAKWLRSRLGPVLTEHKLGFWQKKGAACKTIVCKSAAQQAERRSAELTKLRKILQSTVPTELDDRPIFYDPYGAITQVQLEAYNDGYMDALQRVSEATPESPEYVDWQMLQTDGGSDDLYDMRTADTNIFSDVYMAMKR